MIIQVAKTGKTDLSPGFLAPGTQPIVPTPHSAV